MSKKSIYPARRSHSENPKLRFTAFLLGLIIVIFGGAVAFPHLESGIFFSWDSATYVTNAKDYFESGTLTGLSASYTQSFGNVSYAVNFNLQPEVRLAYFDGLIHPVIMYIMVSSLFFISTYILALIMGVCAVTALVSSLVMVALTMPFTSPPIQSYFYWWHSPYADLLVYQYALLLVTLYFVGRLGVAANVLLAALLIVEVLWMLVAGAKGAIVLLLGASLTGISIVTSSRSFVEGAWRLLVGLLLLGFVLLTSTFDYVRGLYAYTGNMLIFSDLKISAAPPAAALLYSAFPSFGIFGTIASAKVWMDYQLGYPLTVLCYIGVIWTIIRPPTRTAQHLAVAMIPMAFFLVWFAYGTAIGSAMYPLFVIFAVVGILRTLSALVHHVCRPRIRALDIWLGRIANIFAQSWSGMVAVAAAAILLLFAARHTQIVPVGWQYPPSRPPLIELLSSNIRFGSGDVFRGRYLDMSIARPIENGTFPQGTSLAAGLIKTAYDHVVATGNDLTIQGPRFYDIPVALEVNRMATPMTALFYNFLLVHAGQADRIDFRTITRYDARLFQLLGIRYVLSDRPLTDDFATRVDAQQLPAGSFLYEISRVNSGTYSPTRTALISDWRSVLEKIAEPTFDPRELALIHDDWVKGSSLVPGEAEIRRTTGGYRVVAHSAGRSLLVLPFEFSRCLTVKETTGKAHIGRVDFFLTGVEFEAALDAELRFHFGPFDNAGCRLADLADVRAMGLDTASYTAFREQHPGRFLFEGGY